MRLLTVWGRPARARLRANESTTNDQVGTDIMRPSAITSSLVLLGLASAPALSQSTASSAHTRLASNDAAPAAPAASDAAEGPAAPADASSADSGSSGEGMQ